MAVRAKVHAADGWTRRADLSTPYCMVEWIVAYADQSIGGVGFGLPRGLGHGLSGPVWPMVGPIPSNARCKEQKGHGVRDVGLFNLVSSVDYIFLSLLCSYRCRRLSGLVGGVFGAFGAPRSQRQLHSCQAMKGWCRFISEPGQHVCALGCGVLAAARRRTSLQLHRLTEPTRRGMSTCSPHAEPVSFSSHPDCFFRCSTCSTRLKDRAWRVLQHSASKLCLALCGCKVLAEENILV